MKNKIFLLLCLAVSSTVFSQSNIQQSLSINTNGAAPAASAQLDVNATDKGMLVPRLTSAQRTAIASPATGLLVFDTTSGGFWFYNGSGWVDLSSPKVLADTDGDTKIQVEKTPNDNIIRFDLAGTERMLLRNNPNGSTRLELLEGARTTLIGQEAGAFNNPSVTTGYDNTFLGYKAGNLNAAGHSNTFLGSRSGENNSGGTLNTGAGAFALFSNTMGTDNSAVGFSTLSANSTGSSNAALGNFALQANTTGLQNTATGYAALLSSTSGNSNSAFGKSAGTGNVSGSENTAIGFNADFSAGNLNNATAIGSSATVNASNKVRIGSTAVTVIEGQVDWTFPSDARFKFNVRDDNVPGLAFISQLRPVTYQFDNRRFDEYLMQNMPDSIRQQRLEGHDYSKSSTTVQTGFLAQEVEQVCKNLGYEFSGLHLPESDVDNYGLAYGSFVPLLVKALQEQQTTIEKQQAEIDRLKNLEGQLEKIEATLRNAGLSVEK